MASKINYNTKAPFQTREDIPDENKVNAEDMNEIKTAVNNNADELDTAKGDIENLQSGQGTVNTDITSLKNRVNTLESDNKTNKSDISSLKTDNETNKSDIKELQEDNETNKTNITNLQNDKVDKIEGKDLSTNDFTTELKTKLEGLENYDDTEIKEDISNLEAGQTEQDKQIDMLINALPTETQENEYINIKGTIPVKFKEFVVGGNSKQETSDTMPSPEYPSEIQNVEGDVNATVSNKNLFKMPNKEETAFNNITYLAENQNIKINGTGTTGKYPWIIITKNNIYNKNGTPTLNDILQWQDGILAIGKITATLKRISGTSDWEINMNLYDESGEVVNNEIADTTKIVAIGLYLGNGKTFNNLILGIQIEKGEIATEYVEHQEQTVTFPLSQGQKLYLGDYLAEDGIHHVRKQIELDGTDFSLYSNQVAGRTIYTISAFSNNNNFKTYDSSILCNILKQGNSNNGNNYLNNTASSGNLHVSIENSFLGITNESTEEEKLQALQNLIAKTGFIYEGELAEEEIEAYTPEQQEAYNQIKELTAYEEETNVYSTNEISPIFKVTAIKDINSVITQLNQLILEGGK